MTMWRGLHNPDYHEDITEYEVERLTAERDALRASVQRVRDMCDGIEPDHSVFVGDVLDALNGGDDE